MTLVNDKLNYAENKV